MTGDGLLLADEELDELSELVEPLDELSELVEPLDELSELVEPLDELSELVEPAELDCCWVEVPDPLVLLVWVDRAGSFPSTSCT